MEARIEAAAHARGLRFRSIERSFGGRRVVHGLSLALDDGEVVAIVGANGAGKSTLLRIMVGALCPDRGEVALDGWDPALAGLSRPRIGYVADGAPLPTDASVRGTLRGSAALRYSAPAERRAHIDDAMRRFGVSTVANRTIGALSRGWRQRVALADALAARCRLLVLDEPSTGLDPESQRTLWVELAPRRDRLVVISSHDALEVATVATRVLRVDKGTVSIDRVLPGYEEGASSQRLALATEALA